MCCYSPWNSGRTKYTEIPNTKKAPLDSPKRLFIGFLKKNFKKRNVELLILKQQQQLPLLYRYVRYFL